jgi:hypothetical protein
MKSVKIGSLNIPEDYFTLSVNEKEAICLVIFDDILTLVNRQLPKHINRMEFVSKIIESSLITNVHEEKYEVAAVLKDIQHLLIETNE